MNVQIFFQKKKKLLSSPDIVNQPYVTSDSYNIVTDRARLPAHHYYPTPNDEVVKLHFNANFAIGPSFNGKKFTHPSVPFSTDGNPDMEPCSGDGVQVCTNIIDIKYGSIIELTITSYNHQEILNFHHPIHLHGHEMFVLASGTASVNATTNRIGPENANPAFKCADSSVRCHLTKRNDDVAIGLLLSLISVKLIK